MTSWFPTDRRTNAYRLYDKARWSVGTTIAGIAASKLLDYYNSIGSSSSSMPPIPGYARALRRYGYRSKARKFKRSRRSLARRRGMSRRKRRGPVNRTVAGWGPLQKKYPYSMRARLNTRMGRNDYDSTREMVYKNVVVADTAAPTWAQFNTAVYDFPLALTKLFDYTEYRITNLQCVITPIRISNGEKDLTVVDRATPYFYVIPRIHPDTATSTPSVDSLRTTPGVLRFHMMRKKQIVINLPVQLPREDTVIGSASGTTYTVDRPMQNIGWLHQPQDSGPVVGTNYPNFGNIYIYIPQIQSGDYQPKFRVDYYATILLRGNKALALEV